MPQADLFATDMTGRLTAKLGLSHDHEIVVEILDGARHLSHALANYQIGVVDCQMSKSSAADTASEMKRLFVNLYTCQKSLERSIATFEPTRELLVGEIQAEMTKERGDKTEAVKVDKVDEEFNKLMGEGMPPADGDDTGDGKF